MHHIDRTVDEMEFLDEFETDPEFEFEQDYGHEFETDSHEVEGEFEFETDAGEFENGHGHRHEFESDSHEVEGEFETDSMEMELASELLSVNNEAELEEFLGKLFRKVKKTAGNFIKSPTGNLLKNYLKGLARKTLPVASSALGGLIGGPLGASVGNKASQMVGKAMGLELEGLSQEDTEFEISKGYIRFAQDAIKRAASNPRYRYQPKSVARSAMVTAAKRYAPGLLSPRFFDRISRLTDSNNYNSGKSQSGTWQRRQDGTIILHGL